MNRLIVAAGVVAALVAIFVGHRKYIDGHSPIVEEVK